MMNNEMRAKAGKIAAKGAKVAWNYTKKVAIAGFSTLTIAANVKTIINIVK